MYIQKGQGLKYPAAIAILTWSFFLYAPDHYHFYFHICFCEPYGYIICWYELYMFILYEPCLCAYEVDVWKWDTKKWGTKKKLKSLPHSLLIHTEYPFTMVS